MKMDMFKEVPEQFHKQFMDTLEYLGSEEKSANKKIFSIKKAVILVAAVVAAMGTVTIGAAGLYKWNQTAKDRLGVSEEVADKLVMEGAAKEENYVLETGELTFQTIQSVSTARGYYILFSLTTSDGVKVDADSSFENLELTSEKEFGGITLGMVEGSIQGNTSLWQIELLAEDDVDYANAEVVVRLENLVQTEKTDIVATVLEGSWELPITLPMDADTKVFYGEHTVSLGIHQLEIYKVEIGTFRIRLYTDDEALKHATVGQGAILTNICYKDGSIMEEGSVAGYGTVINGENVEACLQIELVNSVNIEQVSALVFGENEILLETGQEQSVSAEVSLESLENVIEADSIEELSILYVARKGHAIIYDSNNVYLWDWECNYAEKLVDLEAISYDEANGGRMVVGYNGNWLFILPNEASEQIYIVTGRYGLDMEENVLERDRATFWESAVQSAYVDDKKYCIISEDGSVANMRLEEVK